MIELTDNVGRVGGGKGNTCPFGWTLEMKPRVRQVWNKNKHAQHLPKQPRHPTPAYYSTSPTSNDCNVFHVIGKLAGKHSTSRHGALTGRHFCLQTTNIYLSSWAALLHIPPRHYSDHNPERGLALWRALPDTNHINSFALQSEARNVYLWGIKTIQLKKKTHFEKHLKWKISTPSWTQISFLLLLFLSSSCRFSVPISFQHVIYSQTIHFWESTL